ncbi:MAG: UDP-phosphate galactose phosphotransferase [Thermodesulfovibrio sp. RBG_19FT_COMBO_42_12]|nr:MAG: UDP-phosphate galactose phosphotransferase [Thermodesulfovibrio sp. RBG_19FT_COMBO_42_12]
MTKKISQVFGLISIDLLAFYISLFIAWAIRAKIVDTFFHDLPPFSYIHFISFLWIPAIFILFIFYGGIYEKNLPFWDETKSLVKSISLASITLLAIVTLGKLGDKVSRFVLLGTWLTSVFIFPIFRLWGKKILYNLGIWKERVLIIGAGNAGRLVMEGLHREKHMGYDVIGFLDDDEQKKDDTINGKKVLGKVTDFRGFIKKMGIKIVIIAMPSLPSERLSVLTADVQNHAANTMVIPDLKGIALINTDLLHLFREELFLMNIRNNLKSVTNRFIKMLFDITVSVISMPLLLPVIGIIGIIIKSETPGPAIYAHDRIGKNGKIFRCYKFRTMYRDAEERLKEILDSDEEIRNEWLENWKLKDDPRITKVGRFLRKTSLDELPQIFNVIKGEMSLVGPRPYLLREKADIGENLHVICGAKPGITGLWQVSGRSDTGYRYRVKLDSWYIMNWSLWLDIAIIFKTIRVVIKTEGAY